MRIPILIVGLLCGSAADATTLAPLSATEARQYHADATAENGLITQANAALAAKDWAKADPILERLVKTAPRWQYWRALADAQYGEGLFGEAVKSYAAALIEAEKEKLSPALKDALAAMYTDQGNAYLKQKQTDKAVAAYEKAAGYAENPGTAYFDICAVRYDSGDVDQALKACDQAIAADPTKADAWFIKGSLLFSQATPDCADKTAASPGTVEALKKYLALAPNGAHADDVKQMLQYLGAGPAK